MVFISSSVGSRPIARHSPLTLACDGAERTVTVTVTVTVTAVGDRLYTDPPRGRPTQNPKSDSRGSDHKRTPKKCSLFFRVHGCQVSLSSRVVCIMHRWRLMSSHGPLEQLPVEASPPFLSEARRLGSEDVKSYVDVQAYTSIQGLHIHPPT